MGVLVVTSDRGLAGAYNSNVLKIGEDLLRDVRRRGLEPVVYVIGKKGVGYFRFRGVAMRASWQGFSEVPPYERAEEIGRALIDGLRRGRHRRAALRVHGLPVGVHPARHVQALPADRAARGHRHGRGRRAAPSTCSSPSPSRSCDALLPQYLITKVYAALLESAASENASRRRAMKAATDNAEDLIKLLTRQANRARQDEITTEISEIVGGSEALSAATSEG